MENNKQHVCKLCNKSFANGRILGGHMRTHLGKKCLVHKEGANDLEKSSNEACYDLRENPKRSWKSAVPKLDDDDDSGDDENHSVVSVQSNGVNCRICDRQFESPRALHGHMRHHSVKERNGIRCKECEKWFKTVRNLTGHMRLHSFKKKVCEESINGSNLNNLGVLVLSDASNVNLVKRKRSNRIRCKIGNADTVNCSSVSRLDESVFGFDDEHDVLDVAMSLIMLSKGVIEVSGGFKSGNESFDTDSLSFEAKFLYENQDNRCSEGGADAFNGDDGDELHRMKKIRVKNFDSCASDSMNKTSEYGDGDYGMVRSDEKEKELELPIANAERYEPEDECSLLKFNRKIEKRIADEDYSSTTESDSSRYFEGLAMDSETCDSEITSSTSDSDVCNTGGFQCRICNEFFSSPQSLGGHQTLHRSRQGSAELKIEHSLEDSHNNILTEKIDLESEISNPDRITESEEKEKNVMTKKSKTFQCQVCFKLFMSGQALGGHKRTHFTKAKEEQVIAMQQEAPDLITAFDLNLPSMVDTELLIEAGGFKSCWPANTLKQEPLLNGVAT